MNKTKKGIVAFILAAALLVSIVGIGIADPDVTWAFDKDVIMYRQPHTESGEVSIAAGASTIWPAANSAQVDEGVPFTAQTWSGQLEAKEPSTDKKCTVEIGIYDGSSFTPKGTSSEIVLNNTAGQGVLIIGLSVSAFTVPKNQWLAARVHNTGTKSFTLVTDGSCYVTYPPDTNYPYPELSTLVLLSIGLLTLIGYVGLRRRNNKLE